VDQDQVRDLIVRAAVQPNRRQAGSHKGTALFSSVVWELACQRLGRKAAPYFRHALRNRISASAISPSGTAANPSTSPARLSKGTVLSSIQ